MVSVLLTFALKNCKVSKNLKLAEWWVHQRAPDQWHGHPLHYDTNETQKTRWTKNYPKKNAHISWFRVHIITPGNTGECLAGIELVGSLHQQLCKAIFYDRRIAVDVVIFCCSYMQLYHGIRSLWEHHVSYSHPRLLCVQATFGTEYTDTFGGSWGTALARLLWHKGGTSSHEQRGVSLWGPQNQHCDNHIGRQELECNDELNMVKIGEKNDKLGTADQQRWPTMAQKMREFLGCHRDAVFMFLDMPLQRVTTSIHFKTLVHMFFVATLLMGCQFVLFTRPGHPSLWCHPGDQPTTQKAGERRERRTGSAQEGKAWSAPQKAVNKLQLL